MSNSNPETALDTSLLEWSDEIDRIMKVAVQKAIAENEQLGIYTDTGKSVEAPRVAEEGD